MYLAKIVSGVLVLAFAQGTCASAKPLVRKEWRALTNLEKKDYISSVLCLQGLPSQTGGVYAGAVSRYDDFVATHINFTDYIHFVGFFQPWHRTFVAEYEAALRSQCGYKGAQPYWDWSLDSTSEQAFLSSPVFDAVYGFGGNGPFIDSSNDNAVFLHIPGKLGGGCVEDGPFVNYTVQMGPGPSLVSNPRCLTRDIAPPFAIAHLSKTEVDYTLAASIFAEFDIRVQGGITLDGMTYHGGGHLGVGGDLGEIGNVYSSPGDPLFYLHHTNMDRLWNKWQRANWPARKYDIAGPDTQFAYPFEFMGPKNYTNITLAYEMPFGDLIQNTPTVVISSVMDIGAGLLSYTYQ
ncbi:Di-copper centre-containing protein [Thozetella sp. PMI_491]|nr:Di-copper centre-containing protein [Thozetella sp. PMI_491]